jgi:hypothetical protein
MERAGLERARLTRLRWRLRGAWMWPTFLAASVAEAPMIHALPLAGDDTPLVSGFLIAGFCNLFFIAVLAPLAGLLLRWRRRDLPRAIAANYAGTALLVCVGAGFLAVGLGRHSSVAARARELASATRQAQDYFLARAPIEYSANVGRVDTHTLSPREYRSCVPGRDPRRWLCVYVSTAHSPASIIADHSTQSNDQLFRPGVG